MVLARDAGLAGPRPLSDDADAAPELARAQDDVDARWHLYEQLAGVERVAPGEMTPAGPSGNGHGPGGDGRVEEVQP